MDKDGLKGNVREKEREKEDKIAFKQIASQYTCVFVFCTDPSTLLCLLI